MAIRFADVEVGQEFKIEGSALIWTKIVEEWDAKLFSPKNCQDQYGEGAWLDDQAEVEVGFDPSESNADNFKTGAKVVCKDPVRFDETRNGFIAKQLDDRHFLVKLDEPFTKFNPGKSWLEVSRDYAHQVVTEL